MSNPVLEAILEVVSDAFRTAPAWSDPTVKVRQHFRQVNKKPVAQGPMATLPPDPFSIHMPIPEDQSGDLARIQYEKAGHGLALHVRQYGETGPDGLVLSIERVPGQAVLKVTASPAPPEPAKAPLREKSAKQPKGTPKRKAPTKRPAAKKARKR
jgi:hypothetical protein